jgi:LacI family transcriptional regulator
MDIREVARHAKVSVATVSRALNRKPNVDSRLVKRVRKAVEELGYYPNAQARALTSGRSRIMGLIVSEITNPFFPEVIQAFETSAVEHNYEILLISTVHDPKRMELAVRRMIERRVDGVAILTFGMEDALIDDLRFRRVPLVFVDVAAGVPGMSNIRIDYRHGIRQAVQHLAALRHVRIAFVTGPLQFKSAEARKAAFEESMREIGLEVTPELLVVGDHTMEGGMQALASLARLSPRPTAILCSNDLMAMGVMRQAYELQISIPLELSVVGFDNIWLSQFTIPALTTVEMSQAELAKLAFGALIADVERDSALAQCHEYGLATNLVLRKTTALAFTGA